MEVDYYYSNDCGIDALMKKVRDPDKGVLSGFIWRPGQKEWEENWELTCGYFWGFEPALRIDEQEAAKYMVRNGASQEEAEAQIRKDNNLPAF